MLFFLNILWLVRTSKYVLFWLYLWQLKEYHLGRFADHFRSRKGRKLVFNNFLLAKLFLAGFFIIIPQFFSFWFSILSIVYVVESLLFFRQIYKKTFIRPVKTAKIMFLGAVCFLGVFAFLYFVLPINAENIQPAWLLIFDILTPALVSAVVFVFQPFFVLIRNFYLLKAGKELSRVAGSRPAGKNLKVIAITGSYGKTSTKEFLTTILSKKYKVLSTSKHQNAEIGIAKCILDDLKPEHEIFIAEVGAYNKGKVEQVCNMIRPSIGIVTGVNEQHLSLFGSMKNLLMAEGGGELAKCLNPKGFLALNGDNKYCVDLGKKTNKNVKFYTEKKGKIDSDVYAENIEAETEKLSFMAFNKNRETAHFNVKVLGRHNVQNLLGAVLVANELGMNMGEISKACEDIQQEQGGMVLKKEEHGINLIDSSYSANPDGVLADLDYLSLFEGKKIIVMPCLIELGKKSSEIHEKIGEKIGRVCDIAIITGSEKFAEIRKGALWAGMKEKNIILQDNPEEIHSMITLYCKSGDAVLLEGRVPTQLINLLK